MSKTIDLQVEKSRTLLTGLRAHLDELTDKGISASQLNGMEADLKALQKANEECDRMREELSVKVKAMARVMQTVKDTFAEKKRIIKGYYAQEEWGKYGVMDKR